MMLKNRWTYILFCVLFFAGITASYATPQEPDILIYKGARYLIFSEPLESFFDKNPERRPKFCGGVSSLARGYVAELEIIEDRLMLNDVRIPMVNPADTNCLTESKYLEVVPGGGTFELDWYSGVLTGAHGEFIGEDTPYLFWKNYERYALFKFEKGSLVNFKDYSNAEYQQLTSAAVGLPNS